MIDKLMQEIVLNTISRRDLVLMLIGIDSVGEVEGSIGGITRLQKFLFLLEKEFGLEASGDGFSFTAYKAGPYSSKLYDDLELLENLGKLESSIEGEATDAEAAEVELLDFDELMGNESEEGPGAADAFEERKFSLTDNGLEYVQALISGGDFEPVEDAIRKMKSKYGAHSLNDLLFYVYDKYPEMTTESEIKDKVLRRRR